MEHSVLVDSVEEQNSLNVFLCIKGDLLVWLTGCGLGGPKVAAPKEKTRSPVVVQCLG